MAAELNPRLTALVERAAPGDWLDLVLVLRSAPPTRGVSRGEAVAKLKREFQSVSGPVRSVVEAAGGTVDGEAWISGTIKCHVPVDALKTLAATKEIVRIDLPHQLSRES